MLPESLKSIVRSSFVGTGDLLWARDSRSTPASIVLEQYINGRIACDLLVQEEAKPHHVPNHATLSFSGKLENGDQVVIKGMRTENRIIKMQSGDEKLQGYVLAPGYVEIVHGDVATGPFQTATCELINLPLLGHGPVEVVLPEATVKLSEVDDYMFIKRVMSALKSTGILCKMEINFKTPATESEIDDLISLLCGLLSLSQRTHVWCVSKKLQGSNGEKWLYQEPIFPYFRPSRPLIPVGHLGEFITHSLGNYKKEYKKWNLGLAQDYYLQSMVLLSTWPQALGFFTALETLKQAYIQQNGSSIERYVSEGKFKKHDISDKVLSLLYAEFPEFAHLRDSKEVAEIDTIKSKVGELNRRAYKTILKKMFAQIDLQIAEDELARLVKFRNDIIHRGMPKGASYDKAFENSLYFASLVEKVFLAILDYPGPVEYYHQGISLI